MSLSVIQVKTVKVCLKFGTQVDNAIIQRNFLSQKNVLFQRNATKTLIL